MDIVAESNINRQLLATTDSLGRDKVAVMQDRIQQINPQCSVHVIDDFISRDNLAEHIQPHFDFVIDCIDDFRTKAALIHYCKRHKINILTVGGAGGQVDPGKVRHSDLSRTQHDVLLARTRKLLRQDYGFAKNLKRSFGVPCVYSDEQLVYPDGAGGLSAQRPSAEHTGDERNGDNENGNNENGKNPGMGANALNCAGGIGSITHVTATFAQFACAHVLNQIGGRK